MTENSPHHDCEITLLEEIAMRARAALASNDGLSREESFKRARAVVERTRSQRAARR